MLNNSNEIDDLAKKSVLKPNKRYQEKMDKRNRANANLIDQLKDIIDKEEEREVTSE